ncbi:MAG TPA: hypothetical protein VF401_04775 [Candidatus Saccharimonadales bacterium]
MAGSPEQASTDLERALDRFAAQTLLGRVVEQLNYIDGQGLLALIGQNAFDNTSTKPTASHYLF